MDQNTILDIMKNEAEENMEDIDKEQFKDSYNQVNNELKNSNVLDITDLFLAEKANNY